MQPTDTSSYYNDPKLQTARSEYEAAQTKATTAQSSATKLPDMLKEALTKKFSTDSPLVQTRETALKDYLNATTQAPLDVTHTSAGGNSPVIYTPLEQSNLIQQKRSPYLSKLNTSNYLLGLAQGSMGDVIDAATRSGQSLAQLLQGEAELKRTNYKDILGELSAKADEAFRERQFQENIRQFNVSQANKNSGTGIDMADKTAAAWENLLNNSSSSYDIYKSIQANKSQWAKQGIDVDQIWENQKALEKTIGKGGQIPDYLRTASPKWQTAEMRNRAAAVQPSLSALGRLNTNALDKLGPQNKMASFSLSYLGGIGVDSDLQRFNAQFEVIRQNALRAFQGGRISDQDYKNILKSVPTITDTKENAQIKIEELKQTLSDIAGKPSNTESNSNSDWY